MNCFKQIFNQGPAFVAYITAGQRGLAYTEQAAAALVAGGVDILEIGVPFSDPVADGPTIQAAMNDALANSVNIHAVLQSIKNISDVVDVPIVIFTYYNPLYNADLNKIFHAAKTAGVDGILVVDLPIEESTAYFASCKHNAIEPICLIAPATAEQRIQKISEQCNSFLYYVYRNGTTGVKKTGAMQN